MLAASSGFRRRSRGASGERAAPDRRASSRWRARGRPRRRTVTASCGRAPRPHRRDSPFRRARTLRASGSCRRSGWSRIRHSRTTAPVRAPRRANELQQRVELRRMAGRAQRSVRRFELRLSAHELERALHDGRIDRVRRPRVGRGRHAFVQPQTSVFGHCLNRTREREPLLDGYVTDPCGRRALDGGDVARGAPATTPPCRPRRSPPVAATGETRLPPAP